MFFIVALLALFCFWLHAQLRRSLAVRLISSAMLFAALGLAYFYLNSSSDFYRRGHLSIAFQNVADGLPSPEKEEYQKVVETYKWDREAGLPYLISETNRLKLKYAELRSKPRGGEVPPSS